MRVDSTVVSIVRDLYEWTVEEAERTWFGTGATAGSFTLHYLKDGVTISVFTVYSDGNMVLNYGYLTGRVDGAVLEEFHNAVTAIDSFRDVPPEFSRWHTKSIADAFSIPNNLEEFKTAVQQLKWKL